MGCKSSPKIRLQNDEIDFQQESTGIEILDGAVWIYIIIIIQKKFKIAFDNLSRIEKIRKMFSVKWNDLLYSSGGIGIKEPSVSHCFWGIMWKISHDCEFEDLSTEIQFEPEPFEIILSEKLKSKQDIPQMITDLCEFIKYCRENQYEINNAVSQINKHCEDLQVVFEDKELFKNLEQAEKTSTVSVHKPEPEQQGVVPGTYTVKLVEESQIPKQDTGSQVAQAKRNICLNMKKIAKGKSVITYANKIVSQCLNDIPKLISKMMLPDNIGKLKQLGIDARSRNISTAIEICWSFSEVNERYENTSAADVLKTQDIENKNKLSYRPTVKPIKLQYENHPYIAPPKDTGRLQEIDRLNNEKAKLETKKRSQHESPIIYLPSYIPLRKWALYHLKNLDYIPEEITVIQNIPELKRMIIGTHSGLYYHCYSHVISGPSCEQLFPKTEPVRALCYLHDLKSVVVGFPKKIFRVNFKDSSKRQMLCNVDTELKALAYGMDGRTLFYAESNQVTAFHLVELTVIGSYSSISVINAIKYSFNDQVLFLGEENSVEVVKFKFNPNNTSSITETFTLFRQITTVGQVKDIIEIDDGWHVFLLNMNGTCSLEFHNEKYSSETIHQREMIFDKDRLSQELMDNSVKLIYCYDKKTIVDISETSNILRFINYSKPGGSRDIQLKNPIGTGVFFNQSGIGHFAFCTSNVVEIWKCKC